MTTLHTFGCSITQGYALPDVVKPIVNSQGEPLTVPELMQLEQQGTQIHWDDIHLPQPSQHAWPQLLANRLGCSVQNHARRGACFEQIARQCATAATHIQPHDVVIVMWTYLSRLSLQWPARTAVPFCNIADPNWGLKTVILGFNRLFGLERAPHPAPDSDAEIQQYIEQATKNTYLNPMGVYNRYYNSLVLQCMTDGFLRATGARVIHLSVESEPVLDQLESARLELTASLASPQVIPPPTEWYRVPVDYASSYVILDPTIPPAENDMHPSMLHHRNFAEHVHRRYFVSTESAQELKG